MEYIILIVVLIGFAGLAFYLKQPIAKDIDQIELKDVRISLLEKEAAQKDLNISNLNKQLEIAAAKADDFEQIKIEKVRTEERLKLVETERNVLKNETISFQKAEEGRQKEATKNFAIAVTLQQSLEKEKERLNDDRVKEKEDEFNKMKLKWSEHEKDVQNHLQLICRNNVIRYISQEDFPHPRNKPDNSIEIMEQLIVFDAKSPANDDLTNFPKYIKLQTENLKKYAKHEDVKNDLFLVIPSNTLEVISQFHYNIGDYNVYIITKDALEPIILSLKKIEDYEFADKLSPEERDNICRIIGKFAHTTKRRIQIDEFFAREFLDTLGKAGTQLPREILENVIKFENAEKLNPPMEKRNKQILTKDLKETVDKLENEMHIREISKIVTKIDFEK
ncbi:hypothetical protein OAN36_01135 [Flavobacteriaceae bacterium]|jgi:hypothetical protein|nr:hypothetical protein [Flavobacteriaceae bacterium]|tara:strand:+ start:10439 stop:11614 length:1176 start_codon:yes stop_codon:yes gene_type:complete